MMICLITSVLSPSSKPLSYAARRSRYTIEQRFQQLCQSIESVRIHLFPDRILVVEGSSNLAPEWKDRLTLFLSGKEESVLFVASPWVDSRWKGQGEAYLISQGIHYIRERFTENTQVFKLSGRYRLSDDFDRESFLNHSDKNVFREVERGSVFWESKPCLYTFFYKIQEINRLYDLCQSILQEDRKESIEVYFYQEFSRNAILLEKLGVEGNISHSGRFIQK